jgi:acyl-CoA thioesterase II
MTERGPGGPAGSLRSVLALTDAGQRRFAAAANPAWSRRVYGGQFLGQAVVAAGRSLPGRLVHSIHANFLSAGDPTAPIEYRVEVLRAGRSFATARVEAAQGDDLRFAATVSLCADEEGLDYHPPRDVSAVARPEGLPTYGEWFAATTDDPDAHDESAARPRPVEVRYANPPSPKPDGPVTEPQLMWMRVGEDLGDDPLLHAAALAYASDEALVDNTLLPHALRWSDPRLIGASLDHAMWFCRSARADRWSLFAQSVVSTAGGRGLARGELYDESGRLCAVAVQEGLIRLPAAG